MGGGARPQQQAGREVGDERRAEKSTLRERRQGRTGHNKGHVTELLRFATDNAHLTIGANTTCAIAGFIDDTRVRNVASLHTQRGQPSQRSDT
jgi:hypothetical protein